MSVLWLPVLLKATLTGLIVVVAAALAEAIGPFWGALIACLPVSGGPAYVFLAMQHDDAFLRQARLPAWPRMPRRACSWSPTR